MWINLNPFKRRKIVVLPQLPLSNEQLEKAFVVEDHNPLWVALLQVIDDMRDDARETGDASVANSLISSNYHGGAQHLDLLKSRMFELRERGIQRQRNPEKRNVA